MFVEDPGGSVGLTAAAKKMRKNISIKQQNKWNKKKEQQQQRQRQTNKEQQGKKKMKNYIKHRGKNELCFQNSDSTRFAKFHSLFRLAKRILQRKVLQAMNGKPGC